MKSGQPKLCRVIGRISRDTKGHPGVFMEAKGLWDGQSLVD